MFSQVASLTSFLKESTREQRESKVFQEEKYREKQI